MFVFWHFYLTAMEIIRGVSEDARYCHYENNKRHLQTRRRRKRKNRLQQLFRYLTQALNNYFGNEQSCATSVSEAKVCHLLRIQCLDCKVMKCRGTNHTLYISYFVDDLQYDAMGAKTT